MKKIIKKDVLKIRDKYRSLNYRDKVEKYEALKNDTRYRVLNEEECSNIFGYLFTQIDGFNILEDGFTKSLGIRGILNLTDSFGIDYKADYLVYKIVVDSKNSPFKMFHCNGYSWVYSDGSIG